MVFFKCLEMTEFPWPKVYFTTTYKENLFSTLKIRLLRQAAILLEFWEFSEENSKFQKSKNSHKICLNKSLMLKFSGFTSFIGTNGQNLTNFTTNLWWTWLEWPLCEILTLFSFQFRTRAIGHCQRTLCEFP